MIITSILFTSQEKYNIEFLSHLYLLQEIDDNQRQRMLKNTKTLHAASDALARTHAVAEETG